MESSRQHIVLPLWRPLLRIVLKSNSNGDTSLQSLRSHCFKQNNWSACSWQQFCCSRILIYEALKQLLSNLCETLLSKKALHGGKDYNKAVNSGADNKHGSQDSPCIYGACQSRSLIAIRCSSISAVLSSLNLRPVVVLTKPT